MVRLEIGSEDNLGTFENIPVPITYQISDVRNPEARKGTFSKTVSIPASQEANLLFENIFEVNVDLQTFDPRLKTDAKYYVDEVRVFNGYAQMLRINKDESNGKVVYELSLIGELKTIFTDIEGLYLTDLYNNPTLIALGQDLSIYDGSLNNANTNLVVTNSWNNSAGYVFPMIDWGYTNSNMVFLKPQHLKGCFYAWDYVFRIFLAAGYTWTSSFLDSTTFFRKLLITPTKEGALSDTVLNNNKFLYNANGTQVFTKNFTQAGVNLTYSETTNADVNFQTLVYDAAGLFVTPTYTTTASNDYNVKINTSIDVVVKKAAVDVSASITVNSGQIKVKLIKGTTQIAMNQYDVANLVLGVGGNNALQIDVPNYFLTSGSALKVQIQFTNVNMTTPLGLDTYTFEATINSGSNFSSEFSSTAPYYGQAQYAIDFIPEDVKQTDFLAWMIKLFNLYVMVDPDNPKNLIIEPREDFYSNTSVDWTYKHDENSQTEVIPLGELNNREFLFTHSEDGDYFNKLFKDEYGYTYGREDITIESDFVQGSQTITTGLAAAPMSKATLSNHVVTTIITKNNNSISSFKGKPRILYFNGAISWTYPAPWYLLNSGGGYDYKTTVPFAGHVNDPFNPTLDLNWGLPDKIYYTYPNMTWTTNNLYNKYYSRYINQISDKNSKIVITDFYLNPTDIRNFDWRKPVFWKDAYYLVNKIIDYNPLFNETTRVELLKLTDYDEFSPSNIEYSGGLGTGWNQYGRTSGGGISEGENNINLGGEASMIMGGENNYIAQGAESVTLLNCENCVVSSDVENFIGVGLSGLEIDSSYSNTVLFGKNPSLTITSDTTLTAAYNEKTVYVDASGGDITITWDITVNEDMNVYFVRTDNSANRVYIDSTVAFGTENFIGNALPYDLGLVQYEALPLTSKSDTIYVRD